MDRNGWVVGGGVMVSFAVPNGASRAVNLQKLLGAIEQDPEGVQHVTAQQNERLMLAQSTAG